MEATHSYKTAYINHAIRHHISGHSHCHKNLKSNNSNFLGAVKSSSGFSKVGWGWKPLLSIPVSTVLCSSGELRFGKYLRNGYTPGAGMWIGDVWAKAFITYITVTVSSDLAANMFGIGTHVFHYHLITVIPVPASYPAPSFFFCFSTPSAHKSQVIQEQAVGAITSTPSTQHHLNHSCLDCISLLIYCTDSSHISCVLNTIF